MAPLAITQAARQSIAISRAAAGGVQQSDVELHVFSLLSKDVLTIGLRAHECAGSTAERAGRPMKPKRGETRHSAPHQPGLPLERLCDRVNPRRSLAALL